MLEEITNFLDLKACSPDAYVAARRAFIEGDGEGFALTGYSGGGCLALVCDNLHLLKERGIYESALLEGYTGCKSNNRTWPLRVLLGLFRAADLSKLRALGGCVPPAGLPVYRGVAGRGRARRVRGLSWTTSLETACWFALRSRLEAPAVFRVQMEASSIFCLTNGRQEDEVVGLPLFESIARVKLSDAELIARSQRKEDENRKRDRRRLAEIKGCRRRADEWILDVGAVPDEHVPARDGRHTHRVE